MISPRTGLTSLAAVLAMLGTPGRATADLLNPLAFASLGSLNSSTGYQLEAGSNGSTPVLVDGMGNVFSSVLFHGVAVFDFTSVDSSIFINQFAGPPIAILSRGDMTISINQLIYGPADPGYPGSGIGGGAAGGIGGLGDPNHQGVVGGNGGSGASNPLLGIVGGGNGQPNPAGGGSAGGAGLEFGAIGHITIGGIYDRGATGLPATGEGHFGAGGGGGGGGISIHGDGVTVLGSIDVSGGDGGLAGGAGGGGGGGGGYIAIDYGAGQIALGSGVAFTAAGGKGGDASSGNFNGQAGADGQPGTVSIVPEPPSLALALVGASGLLLVARRRMN